MRHTGTTVKAIRRALQHGDLSRLGAPGEVEWWFWEGDESRLTVDNHVRLVWDAAVNQRVRARRALYALGFEFIQINGPGFYEDGHVLPSFSETWIGDAGAITVDWNADPTDPSRGGSA